MFTSEPSEENLTRHSGTVTHQPRQRRGERRRCFIADTDALKISKF
jgi:hypothetical protein